MGFGELIQTAEIQDKLILSKKVNQYCVWSISQNERVNF